MSCLRIQFPADSSFFNCSPPIARGIQIAFSIIAALGLTLAIVALVSYLPPYMGYVGGVLFITSLISFAIFTLRRPKTLSSEKKENENQNSEAQSNSSNSEVVLNLGSNRTAAIPPNEIYLHIFQFLDPKDLSAVCSVNQEWNRIASDNSLWIQHCIDHSVSIPFTISTINWKQSFYKAKWLTHHIKTVKDARIGTQLSNSLKDEYKSFIVVEDKIYRASTNQVSIWNASYTKPQFCFNLTDNSFNITSLYLFDDQLFCVDFTSKPKLIRCNLSTKIEADSVEFLHGDWTRKNNKIKCKDQVIVFSKEKAYANYYDGSIGIWDLKLGHFYYEDTHISESYFYPDSYVEMLKGRSFLRAHSAPVTSMKIYDTSLFSSSEDGTIKKWNLLTNECLHTITTGIKNIKDLITTNQWIFGRTDTSIKRWDISNAACLTIVENEESIKDFLVVGNLLFYALSHKVQVFDLHTKQIINSLSLSDEYPLKGLQFIQNRLLAFHSKKVYLWDIPLKSI